MRLTMAENNATGEKLSEQIEALDLSEEVKGSLDSNGLGSLVVLKTLQADHDTIYDEYKKEVQALEEKYSKIFSPLYSKRSDELKKGHIPGFWISAFENNETLHENITDKDATALRYLRDITLDEYYTEGPATPPESYPTGSFRLVFHFDPNPFFENKQISKTYIMDQEGEEDLERAVGDKIDWKPGKDLTVRIMKKKVRGGRGGTGKVITKKEPCDSFFNFFAPPQPPEEPPSEEDLEALEECISADFEIGDVIRNDIIPHAVSYFLDEIEGDDDMEEYEEGEEDDEDDDEDDEDMDDPSGGAYRKKGTRKNGGSKSGYGETGRSKGRDAAEDEDGDEGDARAGETGAMSKKSAQNDSKHAQGLPPAAENAEQCAQQ